MKEIQLIYKISGVSAVSEVPEVYATQTVTGDFSEAVSSVAEQARRDCEVAECPAKTSVSYAPKVRVSTGSGEQMESKVIISTTCENEVCPGVCSFSSSIERLVASCTQAVKSADDETVLLMAKARTQATEVIEPASVEAEAILARAQLECDQIEASARDSAEDRRTEIYMLTRTNLGLG